MEAGVKSTAELRRLLAANEVNKAIKEKQRQEEQALDRKYAREYAAKLDKDEQVAHSGRPGLQTSDSLQ